MSSRNGFYPPRVIPPARTPGFLGSLVRVVRNPLAAMPLSVYQEPYFTNHSIAGDVVWITAPAMVDKVLQGTHAGFPKSPLDLQLLRPLLGNGLLTADESDWRWQRQTVAPLFRHREVLRYVPQMTAAADDVLDRWQHSTPGSVQAVDEDMTQVTFQVIARTMLHGGDKDLCPSIAKMAEDFLQPISWPVAYGLAGLPVWAPFPGRARMRRAISGLRGCVGDIIRYRREKLSLAGAAAAGGAAADLAAETENDLLGRALVARNPDTGATMSDSQVLDTLVTFLLAGHETTAKALTWALYLVACAPDWQERLVAEIKSVAGDRPITGAEVDQMPLLTRFLKETLRLYPPVPVLTRVARNDIEIEDLRLKAGTLVVIPIYAVHRHQRLWQDPDRFDPDRFLAEKERTYPRTQFMPFGAGPRFCVGSSFAMIEAASILATLLRRVAFEPVPGLNPTPVARVTLRPKGGMPLKVTFRQ